MNTDAFFAIGKSHEVCEDYACAKENSVALSDGCSSSPHTDFGARFLCRSTFSELTDRARHARSLLSEFGLPPESLDATLLTVAWDEITQGIAVQVTGDGVVVARRRGTQDFLVLDVSYPSGAPFYLNYSLDPVRLEKYKAEFGVLRVVSRFYQGKPLGAPEEVQAWGPVQRLDFTPNFYDLVMVFSDGLHSFRKATTHGQSESIPLLDVLSEFCQIKSTSGAFLRRRAKRFLKEAVAKGWHHEDDFSVAGVFLEFPVSVPLEQT